MEITLTPALTFILLCLITYKFLNIFLLKPYLIDRSLREQNIPGRYIPFIGEMLEMRRSARENKTLLQYFTEQYQRYGSYYRSQLGPIARLVISDPSLINYILKKNAKYYHKTILAADFLGKVIGMNNILFSEDEVHRVHRKIIQPVFQHHNLLSMVCLMVGITSTLLNKWKSMINNNNNNNKTINIDIQKEMSSLTLDNVAGCIFGTDLINDEAAHATMHESITTALRELDHRFLSLTGVLPIIKDLPLKSKLHLDKARQDMNMIAQKIINDRRQGVAQSACKGSNLLDFLLSAESEGQRLTSEEVAAESVTMIFAGHETTSTLLTWTIYCLTQYPDVLTNLQKEIDSVLNGQLPTVETLSQLEYTEAVLKESLRFYSPVPNIIRRCICDNTIITEDGKEIVVPKGTEIFMNFYNIHHSEKYYKNSHKFDPTRFLMINSTEDEKQQHIFFPFSIGTRSCIGQGFAMLEAKIILAMLVQQFEFEILPGQTFAPKIFPIMRLENDFDVIYLFYIFF